MFVDGSLKKKINLGSINSINWTRIMAQISYYIYAFNKVRDITGKNNVSFSVPTGNFGDAYAGFLAKEKLKIPINKIIVATNSNNILDRFFRTGTYKRGNVYKTISPSMDIQIASNFERLLYDTNNLDGELVEDLMDNFRDRNLIKVSKECLDYAKKSFTSFSINERNTIQSIKKIYEDFNIIVDPHTAIGLNAANKFLSKNKDEIVISLATAHPAKFSESVYSILGINPEIPDNYQDIFKLNEKYEIIDNSYEVIRSYIIKKSLN